MKKYFIVYHLVVSLMIWRTRPSGVKFKKEKKKNGSIELDPIDLEGAGRVDPAVCVYRLDG